MTIEAALSLLVISDAGSASGLAWYAAGGAIALLAVGLVGGWDAPVHASLALLGLALLARSDERLALAPVYGAALLAVSELARTCGELRLMGRVSPSAVRTRLLTVAAASGFGGCAAAMVALAVTGGAARSVAVSAAATIAVGIAFAAIVASARRGQIRERQHDGADADGRVTDGADHPEPYRTSSDGAPTRGHLPSGGER